MKFDRVTSWCEVSDCGGYTVTAAKVGDGYGFAAWHRKEMLGAYTTASAARAVCRQHQENQLESPDP